MNIQLTFYLGIILLVFTSSFSFGQDTLHVKLNKRRVPKAATKSIHLHNYRISSDTIYEMKGSKMTREQSLKLEELQRGNYFIFLDPQNRKIVATYWNMEAIFGHLRYYYRNNRLKREGDNFSGYRCGEWKFYTKKGELRRSEKYNPCNEH